MKERHRAVVAIIEHEGNVLIGKKRLHVEDPLANTWHIPGGKNKPHESDEKALKREMKEEVGMSVSVDQLLDESIQLRKNGQYHIGWFLCHPDPMGQEVIPGSDLIDARFVPKQDTIKLCSEKASNLWPPKVRKYFKIKS